MDGSFKNLYCLFCFGINEVMSQNLIEISALCL